MKNSAQLDLVEFLADLWGGPPFFQKIKFWLRGRRVIFFKFVKNVNKFIGTGLPSKFEPNWTYV